MASLEVKTTGDAPVPSSLVERVRERLGCHLLSAFGQIEKSPMISLNPVAATVEQIAETAVQPLPQTELSICGLKDNRVLQLGEIGEICVRSDAVMTCCNKNLDATSATIDAKGWLHTGDLGTLDAQGFVRTTGRVKNMIIRGGENHFPAEIEAVLVRHPEVAQAVVVGLVNEKLGEVIAAFILSETTPDAGTLRAHCRQYMSPQKTPTVWIKLSEFLLTGSGKVQKFALRDRYLAGTYKEPP